MESKQDKNNSKYYKNNVFFLILNKLSSVSEENSNKSILFFTICKDNITCV